MIKEGNIRNQRACQIVEVKNHIQGAKKLDYYRFRQSRISKKAFFALTILQKKAIF
jgi:hypothetical protein